jgi:COP9 signalosome complex subunit 1
MLDYHLHDILEQLYKMIRERAIVQYFTPFSSVDMNSMAEAFKTSVADLEKELSTLIFDNTIQARIDSHNKVIPTTALPALPALFSCLLSVLQRLYAKFTNERNNAFEQSVRTGEDFIYSAKSALLYVGMVREDFGIHPRKDLRDPRDPRMEPRSRERKIWAH